MSQQVKERILLNLEASRYSKEREFWERMFHDDYRKSVIPGDRPTTQKKVFDEFSFTLVPEVLVSLNALTGGERKRVVILFATVVGFLIHKFANENKVSFAVSNLSEYLPSAFDTSSLIIQVEFKPELTVRQLLNSVRDQYRQALDHRNYPLELFEIGEHESRLFDISLSFKDEFDLSLADKNRTNLCFRLNPFSETPDGVLRYNTNAYSERKALSLVKYFQHSMALTLGNLDSVLGSIEFIAPEEKFKLFKDFNNTHVAFNTDKLFLDFLRDSVHRFPGRIAASDKNSSVTFRTLDNNSSRLANFLIHHGIRKGDLVGILLPRSVDFLVLILAVLKSGAAFVALDIEEPINRIVNILIESKTRILVTNKAFASDSQFLMKVAAGTGIVKVICLEVFENRKEVNDAINADAYCGPEFVQDISLLTTVSSAYTVVELNPLDLCYVVFSSGSTGRPKGILLHHLGMINHFNGIIKTLDITETDCFAQTASCTFDIFVMQTLLSLVVGARTHFFGKYELLDPVNFFRIVKQEKVTILELVPSLISAILMDLIDKSRPTCPSLRYLISNGEQLKTSLAKKWISCFENTRIVNAYGPAETSDDVAVHMIEKIDENHNVVPIGRPLDNINIYVVDRCDQLSPFGVEGEICISGVALGLGYLNDPEKTDQVFVQNPFSLEVDGNRDAFLTMFRTGDKGIWHHDGYLIFKRREDFMVKIRGVRIELEEIEIIMLKYKTITHAFATDFRHNGESILCAYFEECEKTNLEDLDSFLKAELPNTMIPTFLTPIDKMPYNENGKIDRSRLPSPINRRSPPGIDLKNELEQLLLEVWMDVLTVSEGLDINRESNFFNLGGHSLNAIQLASRINRKFDTDISFIDVFQHKTFGNLARFIDTVKKGTDVVIKKTPIKLYYNVSSAQGRFYIQNQLNPEDLSYNCPQYYTVKGSVDIKQIEKSFINLIQTHESLRTSFVLVDNLPMQFVHERTDFRISYSECSEDDLRSHIADFVVPFELNEPGLIRSHLVKYKQDEYLLFVDTHHIISDELSDAIIIRDFLKVYSGGDIKQPAIQYKDYAEWEKDLLSSDKLRDHEKYWLSLYETIPPRLNLPYDHLKTEAWRNIGKDFKILLTSEEYIAVKAVLRETETTPFIFFLSIFNIQLKNLARSYDVVVGTPVSGRDNVDVHEIVGLFLNQLALRNSPVDSLSFRTFLSQVSTNCNNAFRYQAYPFDALTSKLTLQREINETPLYNVMFAHLHKGSECTRTANIEICNYHVDQNATKADLQLTVFESDSNFELVLTVDSGLFEEITSIKILNNFKLVLDFILRNSDPIIADIPIPTEFEFLNKGTNLKRHQLAF